MYTLGLIHLIPPTPPQLYLTISLRHLGFSTTTTSLLTIPANVLGIINLLILAWLSERFNSRTAFGVVQQLYTLPLLALLITFTEKTSPWVYYAVVTLVIGFPYFHAIQVSWVSRNSYSVDKRTVSASIYNMTAQMGAIVSANIYRNDDRPLYKRGNASLVGIASLTILVYIFTFFFYRHLNKRRDQVWDAWTPEERKNYLDTTKDKGNARMDFRFVY